MNSIAIIPFYKQTMVHHSELLQGKALYKYVLLLLLHGMAQTV